MTTHPLIRAAALCLLVLAGSRGAAAQEQAGPLAPGTRVRFATPVLHNGFEVAGSSAPRIGRVTAADTGSVTVLLESDGTEFTVPFSVIRRFEVSRGRGTSGEASIRHARKGALFGAGFGLGIMGLLYLADEGAQSNTVCGEVFVCEPGFGSRDFLIAGGGGAALGGLLGAAIGWQARERWEGVSVRSLRASARGVAVSLRL